MTSDPEPAPSRSRVAPFHVRVTLEDHVALHLRLLRSPAMRATRLRRETLIVLTSPLWGLGGVALGAALVTVIERAPIGEFLAFFRDDWFVLLVVVLLTPVLTCLYLLLARRLIRSRLRRLLRRGLSAHPAVDRADPTLSFTAKVSAGPDGRQTSSASGAMLLSWAVLTRWEETDGRLFVLGDGTGVCVPTAGADPARLDALRRLVAARLGPAAASRASCREISRPAEVAR